MFERMCGVYLITSPSGKRYVGQSVNMPQRWDSHRSMLKNGKHHSPALQRAANKYGVSSLKFEIWANCARQFLGDLEILASEELKPEYNAGKYGPAPTLGITYGPEVRQRMSAAQTGLKRGPYSAEHKAAVSAAKKGIPRRDMLKNGRKVRCIETGVQFEYASAAERFLGKRCSGAVLKVCRGQQATAYGYRWEFV